MAAADLARRDLFPAYDFATDSTDGTDLGAPDIATPDLFLPDLAVAPDLTPCPIGFDECDGDPKTTCETNIETILNCGGCGMACSTNHASPSCYTDKCGAVCRTGYGNCDGDARTNGCETNTGSDPMNCGACGFKCPFGWFCAAGKCGQTCPAPLILCCNRCIDPRVDDLHCGGCNPCPAGEMCTNGVCWPPCPAGLIRCGNGCDDVLSDPSHCGGCFDACQLNHVVAPYCRNGACANECEPGWYDCNAFVGGCESAVPCP